MVPLKLKVLSLEQEAELKVEDKPATMRPPKKPVKPIRPLVLPVRRKSMEPVKVSDSPRWNSATTRSETVLKPAQNTVESITRVYRNKLSRNRSAKSSTPATAAQTSAAISTVRSLPRLKVLPRIKPVLTADKLGRMIRSSSKWVLAQSNSQK